VFSWQTTLFQSPLTLLQHFSDFEGEIHVHQQGHILDQNIYMLAGWYGWGTIGTILLIWNAKRVAKKAFNIGEVGNLVCCHSNNKDNLILWSTYSRILLQSLAPLAKISLFIIFFFLYWLHVLVCVLIRLRFEINVFVIVAL